MQTFDRGEIVEAVESYGPFMRGHQYEVVETRIGGSGDTRLRDIAGWYPAWRFVSTGTLATPPRDIRDIIDSDEIVRSLGPVRLFPGDGPGNEPPLFTLPNSDPERGAPLARLSPPDANPKTRFGMAKPPLSLIPGAARVQLAEAFRDGAAKYGAANWRIDPVSASTYLNAAERHLVSWQDGEEVATDSGVHHLAHAAACLLILLDAQASGTLQDDRPTPTVTADLIREKTRPLAA